ncbi:DUF4426 domain-containing protein [Cognatilysobacter lacus]|uniref:DUF4426 domain-containing protein n=1 Tax=Cognatilysobacter lacus TaxID=1643323 RepID=A0A5D8Z5Q9_9GAMM|nr:DUF4426 domain-containing protein [Lysobacter lacus]TZF90325.1 DUF4426 domain-containing protein [Lysobacter lacus]
MRIPTLLLSLLPLLAACSGSAPPVTASSASSAGMQSAEARVGDVAVHASVVQTSTLDAATARQYGLDRSDRVAMLLLSARRDGDAALPPSFKVEATVADASGHGAQPIVLHQVKVDGLVDYVGTVDISPPDSLRFDVALAYESATSTMQFTREFYPR